LTRRRRHEVQRFALAELIRIACIILAADDNDAFVEGVLSSSSSSRAAAAATGGAPNPSRQKTDFESYKSVDQESSLFLTMDSHASSPVGPAA
jgi:hypothetical protein